MNDAKARELVAAAMVALALAGGCSKSGAGSDAPPAPAMPSGWQIKEDVTFSDADIKPVEAKLGGDIKTLRNTTFEVNGRPIKLNTIVATSSSEADKIEAGLTKIKAPQYFVRKGDTIYEFVAKDDALADVKAGHAHLK